MNRAPLLFTVFIYLICSPAFSADRSKELNANCQELIESLQQLTPPIRDAARLRRAHRFVPWVGVTEEVIEAGQILRPATANEISRKLEDVQGLLLLLRDSGLRLPSKLRVSLMETVTRATSAYYSSLNIPHSVEVFTTVLGQKHWRIKVNPQEGSEIPVVELANQLSGSDVRLQIDFNSLTSINGPTIFEESLRTANPLLDKRYGFMGNLMSEPRTQSRLSLPFRLSYLPDAVISSIGVLHELRRVENSLKRALRQDFPFYGEVHFPFGLGEFFDREPEKSAPFIRRYGSDFSLDENDATAENFFNLRGLLDDSLASFNRELGVMSLERDFDTDRLHLAMANKLSMAVAEAALDELRKVDPAPQIQFTEKAEIVWAQVTSTLKPDVPKSAFVLAVPLVEARASDRDRGKIQALQDQMQFMIANLQNRTKFIEWLQTADELRKQREFQDKPFKYFLRVFLAGLVHPGFTNEAEYEPLTWDRQSRAFRRAVLTRSHEN